MHDLAAIMSGSADHTQDVMPAHITIATLLDNPSILTQPAPTYCVFI